MNTEQKLKELFDYQKFEKNEKLEKMIRKADERYKAELSDDALSLVSAAGDKFDKITAVPTKEKLNQEDLKNS